MRQVCIAVSCDGCLAWDGRDNVDNVTTYPVVGAHTIDLCDEHADDGVRRVLALLGEFADGSAISLPATAHLPARDRRRIDRAREESQAAYEANRAAGAANRRGGKRARARRANAEAEAAPAVGLVCPLCGEIRATSDNLTYHLRTRHGLTSEAVYGLSCPICGHEAPSGRALGTHGRKHHETGDGVPGLFLRATAEGDPLGTVAARARALAELATDE